MGYTQNTENHSFSKSKMEMLALKLIVECEMHPPQKSWISANYSKYFKNVPKMNFSDDTQ